MAISLLKIGVLFKFQPYKPEINPMKILTEILENLRNFENSGHEKNMECARKKKNMELVLVIQFGGSSTSR